MMNEAMNPDQLEGLFEAQRKIQTLAYGRDPSELTGNERIQFIRDMREALEAELQEMIDETGWKPWATSKHVNQEAAQGEMSDVLLFFINLCLVLNLTPDKLAENTFEKMQRNLDRQLEGYDGITGKCVRCKRALDDPAVTCRDNLEMMSGWCGDLKLNGQPYGYFTYASVGRKDPSV